MNLLKIKISFLRFIDRLFVEYKNYPSELHSEDRYRVAQLIEEENQIFMYNQKF